MPHELPNPSDQHLSPPSLPTAFRSPALSKQRLGLALAIAAIADILGAFVTLAPPMVWAVDLVTAILLFMVLGWRWMLLPGIIMEAIPGVSVMPLWVLVVAAIAIWGTARPKLQR
jgi:uncharacterized membrane-anchored protein YitT (DUF2179 family)